MKSILGYTPSDIIEYDSSGVIYHKGTMTSQTMDIVSLTSGRS